jgi:hypothetical protein
MIIIQLKGGLGNQMFQYAFAYSIARNTNQNLLIDISHFKNQEESITKRIYSLSFFNLNKDIYIFEIPNFFKFFLNFFKIQETSFSYTDYQTNFFLSYFDGFFQSSKYFIKYNKEIVDQFTPYIDNTNSENTFYDTIINDINSVSLHVRRGDYLTNNITNNYHGICNIDYYIKAMLYFINLNQFTNFYIFSDDIEWCKNNLVLKNTNVIFCGKMNNDCEELFLMSCCKNNIISNSTFSWWAAWLNINKNKIIISPKNWFVNNNINTKDLIPDSWIKL